MLFTTVAFSPVQNIVGPPSADAVQQAQDSESDRGGVPICIPDLYRCLLGIVAVNGGSELTAKRPLHPKKHSH